LFETKFSLKNHMKQKSNAGNNIKLFNLCDYLASKKEITNFEFLNPLSYYNYIIH